MPVVTRAAIYCRISNDTAETTSPVRQREACEKLVAARGWTYSRDADLYEDIDFSAWSGRTRPAFARLRNQLDQYDAVIYWKLDRLARNVLEYAEFMRAAESAGATLVAVTDGEVDTDTPTGRAMSQVSAVFAELESATISLRIRSTQEHLAKTGRWRGGRIPFGWTAVDHPDGGRALAIDPEQATLVREAASRVVAGESGLAVAEDFNRRGISSPTGSRWHSKTILSILRNPRLVGHRIHRGRTVVDDDGIPLVLDPPLIDRATWERLQRAVSGRDRRRRPDRRGATLLSGLVECGRCGGRMVGWTADRPDAAYACSVRAESGTAACPGNTIARMKTDELVTAAILNYLDRETVEQTRALVRQRAATSVDPGLRRVTELEDAIDRLETDRVELGLYDDPDGRARYAERMRRLTGELTQLRSRAPSGRPTVLDVIGDAEDPAVEWAGWSDARKRATMRATIDRVVIGPLAGAKKWDPERVQVVWRSLM